MFDKNLQQIRYYNRIQRNAHQKKKRKKKQRF